MISLSPKQPTPLVIALAEVPVSRAGARSVSHRRLQGSVGRFLASEAAARLNHGSAAEFPIAGGGGTRPVLASHPARAGNTTVAISHSGNWVAAAAGRDGLGIDVQSIEPRDVDRLAAFMNWAGLLGAAGRDGSTGQDRFTHLWTLWEAAIKCDGLPLLADFAPAFQSLAPHCRPGMERSWRAGGYWAHSRRLDGRHWLTVVLTTPEAPSLQVHRVETPWAQSMQA